MNATSAIQKLLDELERLPGIGPKSAQRIAYWILNEDRVDATRLAPFDKESYERFINELVKADRIKR